MKPQTMAATATRPNRILVALAAVWIVLSFAIGGVVSADDGASPGLRTSITGAAQP